MVVPTPLSTSRRHIQSERLILIHTSCIDLMSTYPRMKIPVIVRHHVWFISNQSDQDRREAPIQKGIEVKI